jgi:O-antigen/teichoic acid export membrane protein
VWVYCFDAFLLAIGLVVMYKIKSGNILLWRWKWEVALNLLRDSWPLILSGVLISIYVKIDQVMIKEIIGQRQVGIYAVATSLSMATYFIPMVITDSLFPAILNAKKNDKDLYHKRLQKLYDTLIWLAIIISGFVYFISEYIIYFLFGIEYMQSASVLKIAIFTGIFVNIGLVNNKYFAAENRQRDILYRSILGVSINIILNLFLIKKYGANGAAFTTIIASFSASVMYTFFKRDARILFYMAINSLDIRKYWNIFLAK